MKKDYRKELEKAAKQMILVHRVDTLIRLILRTIIRNLKVKHAGIFLYDKDKDEYVVKISKGKWDLKLPPGFVKVKKDNPLIKYFTNNKLKILGDDVVLLERINQLLSSKKVKRNKKIKKLLEEIRFQFSLYNTKVCIPGFFRDKLIGVLFLGEKENKENFTSEELGFLSVLSSDVVMAIQNAWLFEDLNKQVEINRNLFLQTANALATAIEAKDRYTSGHTERVSRYSLAVAEEVKKIKKMSKKKWERFLESLKIASLLHDVGKIGIKEDLLNKNGSLTKEERKEIEKHPLVGYSILKPIEEFQEPILGVKYHHERYDGKGYPNGLKGGKIPLIAQIISVADTFDAMTSHRPYRPAMKREKAVEEIKRNKGKQFSPLIVEAFLKAYKKGKI
jgi:HD-GYP domain-containing protein (c-di-GMP phosphodiesterase class II)